MKQTEINRGGDTCTYVLREESVLGGEEGEKMRDACHEKEREREEGGEDEGSSRRNYQRSSDREGDFREIPAGSLG